LLYLLAGLLRPHSGTIEINGCDITHLSSSELDQWRGRNIGFVFQKNILIPHMSVRDNLKLALTAKNASINDTDIETILHQLGLSSFQHQKTKNISQGEAQRLQIARAIIGAPGIILADEPSSALDDANAKIMIVLLQKMARENNSTLIISTHDARIRPYFQNIIHLKAGTLSNGDIQ
jgi:putative ABC transport system ATP-binding protein